MLKLKKMMAALLTTVLVFSAFAGSVAAASEKGWVKKSGCWYYYENGQKICNRLVKIDGDWYFFDADGVMQTGLITISDIQYEFDKNGNAVKDSGYIKKISENGFEYIKIDYNDTMGVGCDGEDGFGVIEIRGNDVLLSHGKMSDAGK